VAGNKKAILLRLDPRIHDALRRWADGELRSVNAQIEYLLRRALVQGGRLGPETGNKSQESEGEGQ
jgi:hypothetical protein